MEGSITLLNSKLRKPSSERMNEFLSHVCLTLKPIFPCFLQGETSPHSTVPISQVENKPWNSERCKFVLRSSANFRTNAQCRHGMPSQEFYLQLQSTVDCSFDSFKTSLIALLISNTLRTLPKCSQHPKAWENKWFTRMVWDVQVKLWMRVWCVKSDTVNG